MTTPKTPQHDAGAGDQPGSVQPLALFAFLETNGMPGFFDQHPTEEPLRSQIYALRQYRFHPDFAWRETDYGSRCHAVPRTTSSGGHLALCGYGPHHYWLGSDRSNCTRDTFPPTTFPKCPTCEAILQHEANEQSSPTAAGGNGGAEDKR